MKKLFILAVFLLIMCNLLISQTGWTQYYDPFPVDGYGGHDVIICSDGGYIVNGSCGIEDPENPGNYLAHYGFVLKIDIEGNLQWAEKDTVSFVYFNKGSAIIQIDDGFLSAVLPLYAGQCALIKRDTNGNREWVIDPGFGIYSMANTNDGNIILAGYSPSGPILQKMTINGDVLWTQIYQLALEPNGTIKSVYASVDNGFLLTGNIYNEETVSDIFIIKTNENGDSLWTAIYDGFNSTDRGNSVIETYNENIVVCGESHNSNTRTIHGLIWCLNFQGETIWLELTDFDFGWAHWSLAEYQDNEFIAFCGFNYDGKFYGFDGDYNILWEMENIGGASGDRCFCVDNDYIIWTESGSSFILHKAIPDQNSVNDNIINEVEIILSNYPNPFNPSTTISYALSESGLINLSIYNIKGQRIKTLANNDFTKGSHSIIWNGDDEIRNSVSSGVYFYKLSVNGKTEAVKKCILLK